MRPHQPFSPQHPAFSAIIVLASAPLGVFEFVLPLYGLALGAGATTIGWLFSVFSITALGLRPLVGFLLDKGQQAGGTTIGPASRCLPAASTLLFFGLLLYLVALSMFALAESVALLVAARLVQGLASTATWLTVTVLLADGSAPNSRGAAFGRFTSLAVWGSGLGAAWTVAVVALLDGATRLQAQALLPELERASGLPFSWLRWPTPPLTTVATLHIVFWGYVVFVALAAGLWALNVRGWNLEQLAPVGLSAADPSSPEAMPQTSGTNPPLMEHRAQRSRQPWALLLAAFLRGGGYALTLPVLTVYLDTRFGAGLVGVGLAYALPGVVYALAPGPLGRLADRLGHRRAAVVGLLLSVAVYMALPLLPALILLIPLWIVEALCFSLAGPALSALLTDRTAAGRRGGAFALYTLAGGIGAALTPALGGWLYDNIGPALPFWGNGLLVGLAALCVAVSGRR